MDQLDGDERLGSDQQREPSTLCSPESLYSDRGQECE